MGDENREAILRHPPSEAGDLGCDSGYFMHDHHTGSRAERVDVTSGAFVLKNKGFKSVEDITHRGNS